MIQRIQSIFLFLAAAASLALWAVPFASTVQAVPNTTIFADRVFNIQDNIGLILLFSAAGILALISIFLYQNRATQMRLTILAFIANLIGVIFGILFYMQNSAEMGNTTVNDGLGVYLPAVTLICTLLAYRFINKDEKLVKSMDRLR